ncbi:MAG: hypothetical protein COA57_02150 [Flavobacteriales bacterium]|nr:MAG: hypothetical protein COA57_02150 [Flavobacteriales bacterium]
MKQKLFVIITITSLAISGCGEGVDKQQKATVTEVKAKDGGEKDKVHERKFPSSLENGKFFEKEGRKYLYGGEDSLQHFDVTDFSLKEEQFHFGIGREEFPALLEPEFISQKIADTIFSDTARFLLLKMGTVAKAYSIKDLTRYEVVNDVVEGKPVMAAYCILADLGAIYDRTIEGKKYTFALSGYTYFDKDVWNGLDGFVMWDRETESLWWPLISKAVSGQMKGTEMKVLDEQYWSQTTWDEIKKKEPEVQVLKPGQDFERPKSWPKYTAAS